MVVSRQKPLWERFRQDSRCPVPGWQCCWWDPSRSLLLLTLPSSLQPQWSRLPISSMSYVVSLQAMPFLLKLVSDELKSLHPVTNLRCVIIKYVEECCCMPHGTLVRFGARMWDNLTGQGDEKISSKTQGRRRGV